MGTTPNFFIAGAAKSGTTLVGRYLAEHPEVFMSAVKEPGYFARDIMPSLHGGSKVLDWGSYLRLFRDVTHQKAIGEASTAYLISPEAPADIRAAIPRARIILMLRNHVDRAFWAYVMLRGTGRLRASFSDIIRSGESGSLGEWRRLILETRKIAPGVERFLSVFPRDQVRWYFYEEFREKPLAVMRSIHEFLGIDPDFRPNLTQSNEEELLPRVPLLHRFGDITGLATVASRVTPESARPFLRRLLYQTGSEPRLSKEDRRMLVMYFREDIERLAKLVGRDLSEWLRVE